MAQERTEKPRKKTDGVGRGLYWLYVLFLLCSLALIARLVYIQLFYQPDPKVMQALTPTSVRKTIDPARGAILSDDGRLLAMSLPIYDIYMDCTVMKKAYAKIRQDSQTKGDSLETVWMQKASELSKGLARILKDKSADEYYALIKKGREQDRRYVRIATGVERREYNRLLELPLFNEDKFHGGLIVEEESIRKYPYGKLARRTIGFVRDNKSNVSNTHVGIEGKFDYVLHGKDGIEYLREIDNKGRVQDSDSTYYKAEDGMDVRTTLNIDFQDIADKALREQLEGQEDIEGGCLVLMEVSTGAIKAMVNLTRDSVTTALEEVQNFAIGRRCEPGSVFKTVTLLSVLSDGRIKSLDETIPTNHGRVAGTQITDQHIIDYEARHKTHEISILDGFKMSSNYVFATLALDNYGKRPRHFIDNIYLYKLGESFDFDIDGLRSPVIPSDKSPDWSRSTLATMGYGYSTMETPLHILTFYNAIAGKGKMMKPYLVESIEKYGTVVEKRGPAILNGSICSKAVADTMTRALAAVTEEGTARRLKDAKCTVAGKTGTSFAVLSSGTSTPYIDKYGRHKYQGTFVGYFPAEEPRYSIICVVYSHPTHKSFQGGHLPALAVKTVVDEVYATDPRWGERLARTGSVPQMKDTTLRKSTATLRQGGKDAIVPDVRGLSLTDAFFEIENAGLKCKYTGVGHVRSQSPEPGAKNVKGETVSIVLK